MYLCHRLEAEERERVHVPLCPATGLERDVYELPVFVQPPGLHVVQQPPWGLTARVRQREFHEALLSTLRHQQVIRVHVLTESVAQQVALYKEIVPLELQHKLQTYSINKRISYAGAVRYANRYLSNTTTLFCNADVSVAGRE